MESDTKSKHSEVLLQTCVKFYIEEHELLAKIFEGIPVDVNSNFKIVTKALLSMALELSRSMQVTIQQGLMPGAYTNARALLETLINICFICAKGDEAADRAHRHAAQKSFRDLDRVVRGRLTGWHASWSAKDELELHDSLKHALDEFSRKGREVRSWTPESIMDRIDTIGETYGKYYGRAFQLAFLHVYRHGSEMIHGTFFGAAFCMGMTSPHEPKSYEEYRRRTIGRFAVMFWVFGLLLDDVIDLLSKTFEADDIRKLSQRNSKEFGQKVLQHFSNASGDDPMFTVKPL